MDTLLKYLLAGLALLSGLLGLAASACGGVFTIVMLPHAAGNLPLLLGVALPSLVVGGLIAWFQLRRFSRSVAAMRSSRAPSDPAS